MLTVLIRACRKVWYILSFLAACGRKFPLNECPSCQVLGALDCVDLIVVWLLVDNVKDLMVHLINNNNNNNSPFRIPLALGVQDQIQ